MVLKGEEIDEGKRALAVQTDPEAVLSTASGEVCAEQKNLKGDKKSVGLTAD